MAAKRVSQSAPSELMLAAQERLLALRQANEAERVRRGMPQRDSQVAADSTPSNKKLGEILSELPEHLGWGSLSAARIKEVILPPGTSCSHSGGAKKIAELNQDDPQENKAHTAATVPIFAHVLDAIHRHKSDGVGRVWLLLRYLDREKGEGRVRIRDARFEICDPAGRLRCLSKKRFQQLIRAGNGRFWHKSKDGTFIYYHSEARVAAALGLNNIYGLAVDVPLGDLLKPIRHVRALFYEAFHCGRGEGFSNPITRRVMHQRGMTDGRTQRQYEALRGVNKRSEFAIVEKYSKGAWQRAQFEDQDERVGGPAFIYIDYKGVLGKNPDRFKRPQGKRHWHHIYIMRQIGNAYAGNLQSVKRGRRWTSHKLRHLCHSMPTFMGSAGSADHPMHDEPLLAEKIYYGSAKEAQKSLQRRFQRGVGGDDGRPRYNPGSIDLEWKEVGQSPFEICPTSFYWEEHFFMA